MHQTPHMPNPTLHIEYINTPPTNTQGTVHVIGYTLNDDKNANIISPLAQNSLPLLDLLPMLPKEKGSHLLMHSEGKLYLFFSYTEKALHTGLAAALKKLPLNAKKALLYVDHPLDHTTLGALVRSMCVTLTPSWNAKSKKTPLANPSYALLLGAQTDLTQAQNTGARALASAMAQNDARMLVDMPANLITPTGFVKTVQTLVEQHQLGAHIQTQSYGKAYMQEKGMGALLGVAQGSSEEPQLLTVRYNGAADIHEQPVVLVGKGVTFDTGGISIKPSMGMDAMKGDMAGAASVCAAVLYAAKAKLPINVIAIAALTENMPSGNALKPGDIIYASDGTSIEVLDTDAEGRLVLSDALLFASQFNPKMTIDLATLTGACVVALGSVHTGVFCQDEDLTARLLSAGKNAKDLAWHMPMDSEHDSMLDSKVADLVNLCIGKGAGAQNGAVFLKHFAPKGAPWAHLDIAGTSYTKGVGATGRPVPLLCTFLTDLAEGKNATKT